MATNATLESLLANPDFREGVALSLVLVADEIRAEDQTTKGHVQRLDFARTVLVDPPRYHDPMMRAVAARYLAKRSPIQISLMPPDEMVQAVADAVDLLAGVS